jgi:hypothetical protein
MTDDAAPSTTWTSARQRGFDRPVLDYHRGGRHQVRARHRLPQPGRRLDRGRLNFATSTAS